MRLALVLSFVALAGCSKKQPPIAELTKADGPVERQEAGSEAWAPAAVGTGYYLGDAARTGDGPAQLVVTGGAQIAMQPSTILRFGGGKGGGNAIAVVTGAIDLSGTGNYELDIGEVKLAKSGTIRITAQDGRNTVKLTLGEAQVTMLDGKTLDLVLGSVVEIGLDVSVKPLVDAGVPDAAVAEVDAGVPDAGVPAGEATVDVKGKKVELLLAGEKRWTPLAAGTAAVPAGAQLRVGAGSTAKLVARGTTLELAGGSRATVRDDFSFVLDAGPALLSAVEGSLALAGGAVAVTGTADAAAEARLDAGGGGTKVTVARGGAKLTGTSGSELAMARGESATLLKAGTIRPLEAIPAYFDLRITAGESLTIHDPRPPTAVQFQFGGKCPQGGIVELDKDPRYRTAKVSAGKESANHLVKGGGWSYRLRCTAGGREGAAVAQGRISVVADSGTRSLPPKPGVNPFDLDGRPWAYSYQSVIPDLAVKFPGTGSRFRLHLARGGKEVTFDSSSNRLVVPGSALTEGVYTYWFDRDGVKQDKVNTLKIDFDQTAPQVYIELPVNGRPWAGDIDVKGAVLPGWSAAVEGVTIPIDKARRFIAKVGAPPGNALAIRLSHPQRGVHYYLRRAK